MYPPRHDHVDDGVVEVAPAPVAIQDDRKRSISGRHPQGQQKGVVAAIGKGRAHLTGQVAQSTPAAHRLVAQDRRLGPGPGRRQTTVFVGHDGLVQLAAATRPRSRGDARAVVVQQQIGLDVDHACLLRGFRADGRARWRQRTPDRPNRGRTRSRGLTGVKRGPRSW